MNIEHENLRRRQIEKIILLVIEVIAVLAAIIFFTFPIFSNEAVKKDGRRITTITLLENS